MNFVPHKKPYSASCKLQFLWPTRMDYGIHTSIKQRSQVKDKLNQVFLLRCSTSLVMEKPPLLPRVVPLDHDHEIYTDIYLSFKKWKVKQASPFAVARLLSGGVFGLIPIQKKFFILQRQLNQNRKNIIE